MKECKFYKNKETGEVIYSNELLDDTYVEIKANTEDAALEKHVPIYQIKDNQIIVQVGEVEHPMMKEHYIMWIAVVADDKIQMKELSPEDKPMATFDYRDDATIYAYCNLHSLWKNKIN